MLKFIKKYYLFILLGILLLESNLIIKYNFLTNAKYILNSASLIAALDTSSFMSLIIAEGFLTIFYYVGVFMPYAEIKAPDNKQVYINKLLKYRIVILLILDIIFGMITLLLDFVLMFVLIIAAENAKTGNRQVSKPLYDLPSEFFKQYGITNVSKFKRDLAFKFCDVMFASNEYDYVELQKLCSNGKFAILKGALESQKKRKAHRIIDNINIYDAKIYKYELLKDKLLLHMNIYANYMDYMKEGNQVVYGSERTPNNYIIDLVFEKKLENTTRTLKYCEECGTQVKEKNQKYCDECGATLVREKDEEWVLKENIVLYKN